MKKTPKTDNPCLSIEGDAHSVSIWNRANVNEEHHNRDFKPMDREFFDIFVKKTEDFWRENDDIGEVFDIAGPKPAKRPSPRGDKWQWQLVIKKVKKDK